MCEEPHFLPSAKRAGRVRRTLHHGGHEPNKLFKRKRAVAVDVVLAEKFLYVVPRRVAAQHTPPASMAAAAAHRPRGGRHQTGTLPGSVRQEREKGGRRATVVTQ